MIALLIQSAILKIALCIGKIALCLLKSAILKIALCIVKIAPCRA